MYSPFDLEKQSITSDEIIGEKDIIITAIGPTSPAIGGQLSVGSTTSIELGRQVSAGNIGVIRRVSGVQLTRRESGGKLVDVVRRETGYKLTGDVTKESISVSRRLSATDAVISLSRRASHSSMPNIFQAAAPAEVNNVPLSAADSIEKTKTKRVEFTEHLLSLDQLADMYSTVINLTDIKKSIGLTSKQAEQLLEEYGPNCLTPPPRIPLWLLFLYQFGNLLMALLLFAGILSIVSWAASPASGYMNLYLGVLLIIVVFATCYQTFSQEAQADNLMEKFRALVPDKASVLRDGELKPVASMDIVIGDIIKLQSGDKIPADCRVILCSSLKVDQSMITGESEPVENSVQAMDAKSLEAKNIIFNGSLVVDGSCYAVAIRTGDQTLIGGMVELTGESTGGVSTLKHDMEYFVTKLCYFAFMQGLIVLIVGCARGLDPLNTFISGFICIILSNVPEGLPSTVTALLSITAERMGRCNVFVKKLDIIETLGSCSLICTDKTGTLTMNQMTVSNMWYHNKELTEKEFADSASTSGVQLHALKEVAALNSRVALTRETPESELLPAGDATEIGLYNYFNQVLNSTTGKDLEVFRELNTKVFEVPFNSSNKWQMSVHKIPGKAEEVLFLKGAPDVLMAKCSYYLNSEGKDIKIDEAFMQLYTTTYEEFGGKGERVLGFAKKNLPKTLEEEEKYDPKFKELMKDAMVGKKEGITPTKDLVFVGLITLMDPPRTEVPQAVRDCNTAGVQVVMVTGDHPLTAQAIARKIGLITLETRESLAKSLKISKEQVKEDDCGAVVIHGASIPAMTDADWKIVISKKEIVFARTSPEQKLIIVKKFTEAGNITAMTGDGVNDSPALKQAAIGIAMGMNGSDVAREAADLVLLDDNFASIVIGIREGRLLFTNLKKSIAYTLAHMTPEVVPVFLWAFGGCPLALSGILVVCIDLLTELLPSISLAYESIESNIMQVPPRSLENDKLVTMQVALYAYAQIGVIETGVCLLVWFQTYAYYHVSASDLFMNNKYFNMDGIGNIGSFTTHDGTILTSDEQTYLLARTQAAWYLMIVVGQAVHVFLARTRTISIFTQGWFTNRITNTGVFVAASLAVVAVYCPGIKIVTICQDPLSVWIFYGFLINLALQVSWTEWRKWYSRTYPGSFLDKFLAW